MTQEEKRLLFKDLCARFPYGVKFPYHKEEDSNHRECDCIATITAINDYDIIEFDYDDNGSIREWSCALFEVKPYLRPMSSMTEEEENEYRAINCYEGLFPRNEDALDYVLSHHLDFRGLIEKGLALEATEDMYKN